MLLEPHDKRHAGPGYPWTLVGLLWFCGFFNYADRQAVYNVFPALQGEFGLSNAQLGALATSFMIVYALSAPFAGFLVDLASRRFLIVSGLGFWSLICAATGFARSFPQLLFFRAAEGLGESFYFPASMTILADYHAPTTRSRAMSIHQTSVYVGSAGGGVLAGALGEAFGWRAPFWLLGLLGMIYAGWLGRWIIEPVRGKSEPKRAGTAEELDSAATEPELASPRPSLVRNLLEIVAAPAAAILLLVFIGANFVATAFMTWLTMFLFGKFGMSMAQSSLASAVWPMASLVGCLCGGYVADLAARRPGGRIRVQALGLLCGAPFVLATGAASTLPMAVAALVGVGVCKGVYDANIFASLYDVVRPPLRGTAAGLMNTVGWTGGSLAPIVVGILADYRGLGLAIASTAGVYVVAGALALFASVLATRTKVSGNNSRRVVV